MTLSYKNIKISLKEDNMSYKNQIQQYNKYLCRRMMISRIIGILACMLGIASLILMYFGKVSEWMCIIMLTYAMATSFSSNSFLQNIKSANAWHRLNTVCSVIFYIFVIALIIYGFITGELSTQF